MVMQDMGMGACIPVIDMKDFSGQSEKLMKACRDWGCFRIVNHSIPESLMMDMKAVSRSLLDLPLELKLRNSHPVQGKGYTSRNNASPVFEGLGCYDMAAPGALDNFFDQLCVSPQQRFSLFLSLSFCFEKLILIFENLFDKLFFCVNMKFFPSTF